MISWRHAYCCLKKRLDDLTVETSTEPCLVGYAVVNADGSVAASSGGAGATRNSTGNYTLTPPANAVFVETKVVGNGSRDDVTVRPQDLLGASVFVVENDNGTSPGAFRDRQFVATWYGECDRVTGVTV